VLTFRTTPHQQGLQSRAPKATWRQLELSAHGAEDVGFSKIPDVFSGCGCVLLTFPITGEGDPSLAFSYSMTRHLKDLVASGTKLCILSSTGAYLQRSGVVSESSQWNLDDPRFGAEETLRQELGATVIVLSGLFGGDRNPLDWLASGRIRNLGGSVNLIHHQDAGICVAAIMRRPIEGQRINVVSGELHWWAQLALDHQVFPPGLHAASVSEMLAEVRRSLAIDPLRERVISNALLLEQYPELRQLNFRRVGDVEIEPARG
jgi:hypothetical protein